MGGGGIEGRWWWCSFVCLRATVTAVRPRSFLPSYPVVLVPAVPSSSVGFQFVSVACFTACDYFGDLRQSLDPFFFERVASMILIHIGAVFGVCRGGGGWVGGGSSGGRRRWCSCVGGVGVVAV